MVAVLTALYVAANSVPIDAFIGGAGFITAGIIILPVIARLVRPVESLVVAIAAPLGLYVFQLSVIPIFGFYGMLIPSIAIVLGSLGFYKSPLVPAAYVAFGAIWYVLFSGGTLVWLIPYFLVLAMVGVNQIQRFTSGSRTEVVYFCLLVTMCEQVTMNIGSISLLQLPGNLWTLIAPFMFIERTVAVVGSSSVLAALIRVRTTLRIGRI